VSQPTFAVRMSPKNRLAFDGEASRPSAEKPDLLLYVLTVMIWTYVWRIQDLFPFLATFKLNLASAAIALGLVAIDRHPARRFNTLKRPILACGLALVGLTILGLPTSVWPGRSVSFLVKELVPNLLLMVLLAASVRSMRDLQWLAFVNVLGACVFSLFVHMSFEIGADGRLGHLIYYDANDLALVLVCTIPFAIFFVLTGAWPYRVLALASSALFVATLAKSGSRGGFLGLVAVSMYVLLAYRVIPRRVRLAAVGGGFALLSLVASDAYWRQIQTLRNPQQDYNWSGRETAGRMEVWKRGLKYMADRPLLGVGLRNFPMAEGRLSEESKASMERGRGFKWSAAHNSFLEVGVELGVLGLALFVTMLVSALRALRRIRSRHRWSAQTTRQREVALAFTLSAAFVGFIVCGFFLSAWYFSYLYMLFGLVIGLVKVDRLAPQPPSLPEHLRHHGRNRFHRAVPATGRVVRAHSLRGS
jgi:O-antigen ligase